MTDGGITTGLKFVNNISQEGIRKHINDSLRRLKEKAKPGSTCKFEFYDATVKFTKKTDGGLKMDVIHRFTTREIMECPICKVVCEGASQLRQCVAKHVRELGGLEPDFLTLT